MIDESPPRSPFREAVDAYRARFGAEHLPHLLEVDEALATRALQMAIRRGRPIRRGYVLSRLSGGWRQAPPPWMLL